MTTGVVEDLHSSYESEFLVVESSGLEFLDVEVSERLGSIVALHLFDSFTGDQRSCNSVHKGL